MEIPSLDISNFELEKMCSCLIAINIQLNIHYQQSGKEKTAMVAAGFTSKSMQEIANEIQILIEQWQMWEKNTR